MNLEPATWSDIVAILRETFAIWSPGLTRDEFLWYTWRLTVHPFSKRNFEYLVLRHKQEVAASVKYTRLRFLHRNVSYKFVGLGAVYTQKNFRNQGYGSQMLELAIDKALSEGSDGMFLFSDINPAYYERFDFIDVGNQNVHLMMTKNLKAQARDETSEVERQSAHEQEFSELGCKMVPATFGEHPALMHRYYQRWLHTQLYGVDRCEEYFHYKLWKENFLSSTSRIAWPRLELIITNDGEADGGYALTEHGGPVLRVLELVGSERVRVRLWQALVVRARQLRVMRISGWESILQDLGPSYTLNQLSAMSADVAKSFETIIFTERPRARCMILPLKAEVANWALLEPCPVLELDHL